MTIPLHHPQARHKSSHATNVVVTPALTDRNRITCAFRPILAIPHMLLVGVPTAFGITLGWKLYDGPKLDSGVGPGVLGLVAGVVAMIGWFAILFTREYPQGLWNLAATYLRWRTRAMAYMALLTDAYPPFGDDDYPVHLEVRAPDGPRNRLTTAFRIFLLIPQFIVLWLLSVMWLLTTIVGWFAIIVTGRFPAALYDFGCAVLRWSIRVEAYLLLLHDEYPPFELE